jgi:UDP-galactopyranose mutase
MKHFNIVGAGLTGATVARYLVEADSRNTATVYDSLPHVAGNCHTVLDEHTGILVHTRGAHIFHTSYEEVWAWVNRFSEWDPYRHTVRTRVRDSVYSMPINLHTLNQFFDKSWTPDEAWHRIAGMRVPFDREPANFEEQALSLVGEDLYEHFFKGYTIKQWGRLPTNLPASVMRRLPVRFNYNDGYFDDTHQAMPRHGYTHLVERMLDHHSIEVQLNVDVEPRVLTAPVIWTGPVDQYFDYEHGWLGYRTLDFETCCVPTRDSQGIAVMNYPSESVPYTRVIEHRHFMARPPDVESTLVTYEHSREAVKGDVLYYPVRLAGEMHALEAYRALADAETNVYFAGRLGTYSYIDMDDAIHLALQLAEVLAS